MPNSEKTKVTSSFLTLQLDIGAQEFYSIEELQEWLNQERSFFAWMEAGAKNDSNAGHAWNATSQWLSIVNQYIQQYPKYRQNEPQLQNITKSLHAQLGQHLKKGHLITSKNPDAVFGKNLAGAEDEVTACYAIANLLEINTNQNSAKALKGAFYAFQYRQGSTSTIESHAESLVALGTEWNDRFNRQHLDLRTQHHALVDEVSELRDRFYKLTEEISVQKDEQATTFDTLLAEYEHRLSDIAKTYDEKLALQSSVKYWTKKCAAHTKVMLWAGGMTLGLAFLTGGGFTLAAHKLLQVTVADLDLWRLGVVLAISTFGIWVTRLSAKIFVSNLHLRTDADERVTMIQTYLALLREGSGPMEDERQLILQTLFRPSNSGFIKDEGPSSFHEWVANVLAKRKA